MLRTSMNRLENKVILITGSVTGIGKAILEGGAAVGKSAVMPSNPDLQKKPEVVGELVKIVRDFGKAP